jgi:hypothetical protein
MHKSKISTANNKGSLWQFLFLVVAQFVVLKNVFVSKLGGPGGGAVAIGRRRERCQADAARCLGRARPLVRRQSDADARLARVGVVGVEVLLHRGGGRRVRVGPQPSHVSEQAADGRVHVHVREAEQTRHTETLQKNGSPHLSKILKILPWVFFF